MPEAAAPDQGILATNFNGLVTIVRSVVGVVGVVGPGPGRIGVWSPRYGDVITPVIIAKAKPKIIMCQVCSLKLPMFFSFLLCLNVVWLI